MEASKIRRRTENQLKQAVSLGRRSSSGLSSLQKRLEGSREKLDEISSEFNQILARKESLERLVKTAQDRLKLETDAKEQAEIDLANADTDESKQAASERVSVIEGKIEELESEIRQRTAAADKLVKVIEEHKKSKMRTSQQIHKQAKTKPQLLTLIKKSHTDSEKLQRQFEIASKKEAAVSKTLSKVAEKLEQAMAKKRKAAARKAALKRAAARKAALKRAAARKKAARKAKRKAAPKRKATKKATKAAKPKRKSR